MDTLNKLTHKGTKIVILAFEKKFAIYPLQLL